ncbi:hypothetical protein BDF21DRAFT_457354 [Thamnidium elegans]|nr:hypothetical protein BDF21DRAFT_457354 [Thamnidium elegans]
MVTLKWNSLKRMNLLKILSALNWSLIKIIETLESFYLLLRKRIMLKINLITNNERRQHQVLLKNLKIFQENVRDPTVENPTENAPLQDHLKLLRLHRTSTLVSKKLSTLKPKIYETCHNGCTMIYAGKSNNEDNVQCLNQRCQTLEYINQDTPYMISIVYHGYSSSVYSEIKAIGDEIDTGNTIILAEPMTLCRF